MSTETVPWNPNRILRPVEAYSTGSAVIRVETDQGVGFLKAMGADSGPHVLACELVGTLLAQWLKLPTLEFALIDVPGDVDLQFANGKPVQPGPAFITRYEKGRSWSGDEGELAALDNPQDIGRLVVFDTWTMNCDRYRPPNGATLRQNKDNVWFSEAGASKGKLLLKAIDHGCCFTCEREVTRPHFQRTMNDARLYGLFPPFQRAITQESMLQATVAAAAISREEVDNIIGRVPRQWQVDSSACLEWCDWICHRARTIRRIIEEHWTSIPLTGRLPEEGQTP